MRHFTVHLTRDFTAPPDRVFSGWTDPDWRARFETPEGSGMRHESFDTRAGGTEIVAIEHDGNRVGEMIDEIRVFDPPHRLLVQGRGIFGGACRMTMQTLVEFEAAGTGTRMHCTSQIAALDDQPTEAQVTEGWTTMLDRFETLLNEDAL